MLYQIGGKLASDEKSGNMKVFEINLDPHDKDYMVSIQLKEELPVEQKFCRAVLIRNYILVAGEQSETYALDLSTKRWVKFAKYPSPSAKPNLITIENRFVYYFCECSGQREMYMLDFDRLGRGW